MPEIPAALRVDPRAFVRANLRALGVPTAAEEGILDARGPAAVRRRSDGAACLEWEGALLDAGPPPALAPPVPGEARVLFGLGVGRALEAVLEGGAPTIVYEPSRALARLSLERGPVALGRAVLATDLDELREAWSRVALDARSITLVRTGGYAGAFPEKLRDLEGELRELLGRTQANQNTHRVRGRAWVEHLLDNAPLLASSLSLCALGRAFEGVPAFVVGAGPSLSKNVAVLREAARSGLVLAVNSALPVLAAHGIQPHVVACMESADVSGVILGSGLADRAVRLATLTAHPANLRAGSGPLLLTWSRGRELDDTLGALTGARGLPTGASVSTLAFSLAEHLGCSPIVLVGQDLAYTGGQVYAQGSPFSASRAEIDGAGGEIRLAWSPELRALREQVGGAHAREPLQLVPGWGTGAPVPSGPSFSGARAWLESAAALLARERPELELANATEGGARVRGFPEASLASVVGAARVRDLTPDELARAAGTGPPVSRTRVEEWRRELSGSAERLARAADLLGRTAERALTAVIDPDPARAPRALRRLERAERALRAASARAPIAGTWSFAEVEAFARAPDSALADARDSAIQAIRRERELAHTVRDAASALSRAAIARNASPIDQGRIESCP